MTDYYVGPYGNNLKHQDIVFERGSEEELRRLVALIFKILPEAAWAGGDIEIMIYSAFEKDYEDSSFLYSGDKYSINTWQWFTLPPPLEKVYEERLSDLVGWALVKNRFTGYHFEYNDGASNYRSGYDQDPHFIEVIMVKPTGHERLEAQQLLLEILKETFQEETARRMIDFSCKYPEENS